MRIHDQHVHSKYSMDSNQELEPYIQKAIELGCKYFVTTDHVDFDLVEHHINWSVDYASLKAELKKLQYQYPNITLLLGIEMGYRKDHLEDIDAQLKKEQYDVVNLSIHDNAYADFYWEKYFIKYGIDNLMNVYFDEMIEATSTFLDYDVLSHIDYGFKTIYFINHQYKISKYENKIKEVMKNIIQYQKALEINTKVQEAIHDDTHTRYLLQLYKSLGGEKLTLSSDAHSVERYQSSFEHYKKIIKECGFHYLVYFIKRKEYIYYI